MSFALDALRALWRSRESLVILQLGFGTGSALLQLRQAWRDDGPRCARVHFIAIDIDPCSAADLRRAHAGTPCQGDANALAALWPPLTHNLHRIEVDPGHWRLLLAPGAPLRWLPDLQARVDVFLIDEFDGSSDPQQAARRLAKGLARLAAPGAMLWAHPSRLADALGMAGFERISRASDRVEAVFRPSFVPRQRNAGQAAPPKHGALIVGAGLAGCAIAGSLAELDWHSTLFDRRDAPATMASGNPAGLFHGVVNPQDGAHARFNRAAALQARWAVQRAIDHHGARGSTEGVLRLENKLPHTAMQEVLDSLRLPPDYVQALDAAQAGARCGLPLSQPAWFYPGGGWVQPAALARSYLQCAGAMCRFRGGVAVQSLRRDGDDWVLLDDTGQPIARSPVVVLANAADALRLLHIGDWPMRSVRGQISLYDNDDAAASSRLRLPRLPIAGAGYLLPPIDGLAVFGASSQPGDADGAVRATDHAFNLQRLRQIHDQPAPPLARLTGRVGWRLVADDRLPLVGAVPDESALADRRIERPRDMPRHTGLYLLSALASRGIAWSALGAQLLAAQIAGAPLPLEAPLVRAIDPARFALRRRRARA